MLVFQHFVLQLSMAVLGQGQGQGESYSIILILAADLLHTYIKFSVPATVASGHKDVAPALCSQGPRVMCLVYK